MIKPTNATVVEEETKNSAKESSDSDDDESSCMEMSNTDISLQSPNNNTKGQGLIKLKGTGMKSSLKKKDKKEHSIKSTTFHAEAMEQTGNPEEIKAKNKTSADGILEKNEKEAQDKKNAELLKTTESESLKTIETPIEENKNNGKTENLKNLKKEEEKTKVVDQNEEKSKIPEEYLKEKEEAMKKFSDKITMLEGQINSSGGGSLKKICFI